MQDLLRKQSGIVTTRVGYTGGTLENPTYKDICTGQTGHAESIEITFDPAITSYRKILEFFFQIHDPTTANRQGNDIGTQYRSAVFVSDGGQRAEAVKLITELNAAGLFTGPIVTEITDAGAFYQAEADHQDYLENYPNGYTCHFVRPDWAL
jgi:peptide-methionine (S)-S-oxide reductase